jgi:hypothetical protein
VLKVGFLYLFQLFLTEPPKRSKLNEAMIAACSCSPWNCYSSTH